jgi:hypothetical protein
MYKLKKISHLLQFKEKNYFKPMCCIIISDKLEKNEEFFNILKKSLSSLQNDNNYIVIYLINSDKFEDEDKTYNDLDKDKPYFLMFFRSIQYEFFNNPINEFIPNIVSKICSINDGYLANISKAFASKEKQETVIPDEKKIVNIKEKTTDNSENKKTTETTENKKTTDNSENKKLQKKKIEIIEEIEELTENIDSSISSSDKEIDDDIEEKKKLLKEKQKLLQEINE